MIAAQSFAVTWTHLEDNCKDIRKLTQKYNDIQMNADVDNRKLKKLREKFTYAIMRKLFICPVALPPATESYLRVDFEFAEYLSRALALTLDQIFQLNWAGYVAVALAMVLWRGVLFLGESVEFAFFWIIPALLVTVLLVTFFKLKRVLQQLVPKPTDQLISNFPSMDFRRTPEMDIDIFRRPPPYLEGHFYPKGSEINYVQVLWWSGHPLELTFGYILGKEFPNRHDLLFWFDSYGVAFLVTLFQVISIVLTLWLTVILIYYTPLITEEVDYIGVLVIALAVAVWLFISFYLLPENIQALAIVSSIEMKKHPKVIQEVILDDKIAKSQMIHKIYRQFKHRYAEVYNPVYPLLPGDLHEFSREVFYSVADPVSELLTIDDLHDVLDLCGAKLQDDELRFFAVACNPDEYNEFNLRGFQQGIAMILNNSMLDPQNVTSQLLVAFLQDRGERTHEIGLELLREFFDEMGWHLPEDDIEAFLWETRWMLNDNSLGDVRKISSMVRTNIDFYPH